MFIDAYFWRYPFDVDYYHDGMLIMNGLEANDEAGGSNEAPREPNGVVRRQNDDHPEDHIDF